LQGNQISGLFRYSAKFVSICFSIIGKRRLWGDLTADFHYLKGAYRKHGENIFIRACCDRTRSNGFKLREGKFRLDIRKILFSILIFLEIAQRGGGGPIPGNIQSQVGRGSEQSCLDEDIPAGGVG